MSTAPSLAPTAATERIGMIDALRVHLARGVGRGVRANLLLL